MIDMYHDYRRYYNSCKRRMAASSRSSNSLANDDGPIVASHAMPLPLPPPTGITRSSSDDIPIITTIGARDSLATIMANIDVSCFASLMTSLVVTCFADWLYQ